MNISKEFLMEAVGLSLLVALILISMQLFQRTMKITALLEGGQEQKISELEEYEIIQYEGMQLDGMTAVSYIKKMVGTYELPVLVVTTKNEFKITERSQYGELRDAGSEYYINPLAKYRCEVVRDENEVITEVKICIENGGN